MADKPTTDEEELFRYELDPVNESEELDQHRARFSGLSLENYRTMRAYVTFKLHHMGLRQDDEESDGEP